LRPINGDKKIEGCDENNEKKCHVQEEKEVGRKAIHAEFAEMIYIKKQKDARKEGEKKIKEIEGQERNHEGSIPHSSSLR
jgi:hypothetical protein